MRKFIICFLIIVLSLTFVSCKKKPKDNPPGGTPGGSGGGGGDNPPQDVKFDYRVDRDFTPYAGPTNEITEADLIVVPSGATAKQEGESYKIGSGYALLELKKDNGKYKVSFGSVTIANIINIYFKGSNENLTGNYDSVEVTSYGLKAKANLSSKAGTKVEVVDMYYFNKEAEENVINIRKTLKFTSVGSEDKGFGTQIKFDLPSGSYEYFAPNNIFKTLSGTKSYLETYLGIPFMMMRNTSTKDTFSVCRYQPIISYDDYSYASFTQAANNITINYPAVDGNRMYKALNENTTCVADFALRMSNTDSYDTATPEVYNAHFNLQNTRIVNTDINEVYKVINEDYKVFLHEEVQEDEKTKKKYTSYGLPWRITIEDGEFGPLTYQAGFIGQQIPSAYNMMLYGTMNNDLKSLQNGINVIDFWVDGAEFMSVAGVPHIWYDTWADGFRAYPCFLRMAIDCMEGLLDAYRLALAQGLYKENWEEAIYAFGEFLLNYQNEDGSYYRCYNYEGGPFENWDDGIEEPQGNICRSYNKNCTPMAVRFLGKMYEFSGDESYKEAALKAGDYIYNNLFSLGYYQGGTCDNPNQIDKEGGVFAIYAYDTLYMLTRDSKWLTCLKQAVAFTMSTVLTTQFAVRNSKLKSAYPLYAGYSDGLSFICCNSGGVDNYIAYIYYELFRVYILTGDANYLKQAEFIQQNTKSVMNWDDTLGYKYKSLVAEASSICNFSFSSASDGAWVTWSSVANAEPIAKMYTNFGNADVACFKETSLTELRSILDNIGIGGKEHKAYTTDIYSNLN